MVISLRKYVTHCWGTIFHLLISTVLTEIGTKINGLRICNNNDWRTWKIISVLRDLWFPDMTRWVSEGKYLPIDKLLNENKFYWNLSVMEENPANIFEMIIFWERWGSSGGSQGQGDKVVSNDAIWECLIKKYGYQI